MFTNRHIGIIGGKVSVTLDCSQANIHCPDTAAIVIVCNHCRSYSPLFTKNRWFTHQPGNVGIKPFGKSYDEDLAIRHIVLSVLLTRIYAFVSQGPDGHGYRAHRRMLPCI